MKRPISQNAIAAYQRQLDVVEIAFRLGFAHPPAFHRAFKRWQGISPNEHRATGPRSAFYPFHRGE